MCTIEITGLRIRTSPQTFICAAIYYRTKNAADRPNSVSSASGDLTDTANGFKASYATTVPIVCSYVE